MQNANSTNVRRIERRQTLRREEDIRARDAAERALLLSQSLIGTNYQNRTEREGIRHFIGCMQLLLQEPLAIVLLRKDLDTPNSFLVLYHTLLDPLVKDFFEQYLCEEYAGFLDGDNLRIPADKTINKAFNIHTDYFVMLFRLLNYEREAASPCEFLCLQTTTQDIEIKAYLQYFSENSHMLSEFVSDGMEKEFDLRAGADHWRQGKIRLRELEVDLGYEFINEQGGELDYKNFYQQHFEKISSLFNDAYEKIRDSALLKSNQFQPPNIMFGLRMFDRTYPRMPKGESTNNGPYPYGIRGLIPQQQKRDIVSALSALRRIQRDERFSEFKRDAAIARFYFPKPASKTVGYEQLSEHDFPAGGNANFGGDSEFFWQLINSNESFDSLLSELESSYGDHARGLSDSVFSSGFVSVAQDPYITARAMRLSYRKWMAGPKDEDYRRLVYYHYLMSMAAAGAGSMSALVIPGRVGGSVWFTMGYYFTDQEPEHKRWLNCYHFYHNVAMYFSRSIRSGAKRLYLKELKSLLFRLLDEVIPASSPSMGVENYPQLINAYFKLLCRVYPFALVQLSYLTKQEFDNQYDEFSHVIQGKLHFFKVAMQENPYFASTTGAEYVKTAEVVDTFKGQILIPVP